MEKAKSHLFNREKHAHGFTLFELMTTITISLIPISVIGILLVGGQRSWNQTYTLANDQIKIDSQTAVTIFCDTGRNASWSNSFIFSGSGTELTPSGTSKQILSGEVVEFRYWHDRPIGKRRRFEPGPGSQPTDYARFYFDSVDNTLNIDYGPYPYSYRGFTTTKILAQNVTSLSFTQMAFNGVRQCCIKMNLVLTDPDDGKTTTVMATALMHN